jgi:carbon storage regulator CsrA
MLVLSRRLHEKIVFPGIPATVEVVAFKPGVVRLGIEAPPEVTVLRGELQPRPEPAADPPPPAQVSALVAKRLSVLGQGLTLLREQLRTGRTPDAAQTLDEVEDELRLLGLRLAAELSRSPSPPAAPRKARKALLVEDNTLEREAMARLLRRAGFDVDEAGDGLDALDHLRRRGRPDVLLLDMGLPRCDGATTVREVRRNPAYEGLKIFAVTGHRADEFDLGAGPAGIDRWFHKPIDPAALARDVSRELEQAAGPQ